MFFYKLGIICFLFVKFREIIDKIFEGNIVGKFIFVFLDIVIYGVAIVVGTVM